MTSKPIKTLKTRGTATAKDAVTEPIALSAVNVTTGARVAVLIAGIVMTAAIRANVKTANAPRVAMRAATNPAVIVLPKAMVVPNATNHRARTNRTKQSSPRSVPQSNRRHHNRRVGSNRAPL